MNRVRRIKKRSIEKNVFEILKSENCKKKLHIINQLCLHDTVVFFWALRAIAARNFCSGCSSCMSMSCITFW